MELPRLPLGTSPRRPTRLVVGGGHRRATPGAAADRGRCRRARRVAGRDAGDRGAGGFGRDHLAPAAVRGRRPRRRLVRHRRHRRPRGQRPGQRAGRAAADLLRPLRRRDPGAAPGPPRSDGTPGSPSPCSATASPDGRSALRDEILEGLREGRIAAPHHRDRTPGVTLVGGGPGDPELMSIAGRKALMEADVVVADRLAPRELLGELPADVELIDVAKLPRGRSAQQDRDQPGDRRARARRQAGRPVQGRRQLRLRPRLRGGHRVP